VHSVGQYSHGPPDFGLIRMLAFSVFKNVIEECKMWKRCRTLIICQAIFLIKAGALGQAPGPQTPPAPTTPSGAVMPPVVANDAKLTLAQALAQSERFNPQLAVSAHTVLGARANFSGQRAPVNPVATVTDITNTPQTFDPSDPTKYGAVFTLETSGRQAIRTQTARAQLQGAQADAKTTQLSVRQSVAAAYVNLQAANALLKTETESYADALKFRDLTSRQLELGAVPQTNAIRASVAFTQEQVNMDAAVNAVLVARVNLNYAIGRDPNTPVDAADPLAPVAPKLKVEDLLRLAFQQRPELESAEAIKRSLQSTVRFQRSQYYPDLQLGINPIAVGDGQVQLSVSLPLFDLGSIRGSIRKAQEDVKVQESQAALVRETVAQDVLNAELAVSNAQKKIAQFQSGILPLSQSLLTKTELGYQLGANSILEVLDAQSTYRSTRNDYTNALADLQLAIVNLERAVGASIGALAVK
jgi:cobalt-zinc-cadmium efflux system outer membrane protein